MTQAAPTPSASAQFTGPIGAEELPKGYIPADYEPAIRARWEASDAWHPTFAAASPASSVQAGIDTFAIFIPPPNVTAALHLGHALNNTLQDILVRHKRMLGFATLWMPGTDHAGIATQAVAEKRVKAEEGKRRKDFSREAFVAKIQAFKDEYEATITGQLKAMGCSCDWQRQRFTMDPQCTVAVYEAFFRLFADGLIYRGKRLVNWDPVLQTAVADDECEDIEIDAAFYYIRYSLAAPVTLPSGEVLDAVTVATTRPETYLGDTAVAMNPADPRASALVGKTVRLPMIEREIPIIADDYVVLPQAMARSEAERNDPKAQFATGFLKVTPAHDPNDYEIGQRHALAMINILAPDGSLSATHGWENAAEHAKVPQFIGLKREAARKEVVKALTELGYLVETKPYRHSIKHSDRSRAIVEPYLSDQWYVKVTDPRLAASANAALAPEQRSAESLAASPPREQAATDGGLRFVPARYARAYEHWHDGIRDWCISRQLWWGHQIPVWRAPSDDVATGAKPASTEALASLRMLAEAKRLALGDARTSSGVPEFVCLRDPKDDAAAAVLSSLSYVRDEDVLDTWFSSALWPLSTLGWPNPAKFPGNQGLLEHFNPSSVLCTAREIITLWVSRMVMMNRYLLANDDGSPGNGIARLPFRDVFIHAVIQDGQGRKMSKSLGNGVDPLDIIASHGSDAMRYTLANMVTQTQDVRMPVQLDHRTQRNTSNKFDAGRNFCNKLWNAARFTMSILGKAKAESTIGPAELSKPVVATELAEVDRWMLSRLARATAAIDTALANYEFGEYTTALYDLLWRDFCDWYLEAIKPTVAASTAQQAVLATTLHTLLRLLQPVAPFVTEAIYQRLSTYHTRPVDGILLSGPRADGLLATAGWPSVRADYIDPAAENHFDFAQSLASEINIARAAHQVAVKRRITLHMPEAVLAKLGDLAPVVSTMCALSAVTSDAPPAGSAAAAVPFAGVQLQLSNLTDVAGPVDAAAEHERMVRLIAEKQRAAGVISGRLASPGYTERAPAKLVEQSKAELAKIHAEIAAAEVALAQLKPRT